MNIRKKIRILLFLMIIFFSGNISYAENTKTFIIVTDELDFSSIEKLDLNSKISLGLMNTRTANVFNRNKESYFMTMATGRRVSLERGLYKGLSIDEEGNIIIDGYEDIIKNLNKNYKGFSKNMFFLADALKRKDISIGYLGNGPSSLIAADKNGIIYNGFIGINYDKKWLIEKTADILEESDVIVVSFDIAGIDERVFLLKEYIEEYSMYNILLFPSSVSGDIDDIRNSTLVPVLYNFNNKDYGILTSDSTKRKGLITNMDMFSELGNIYGFDTSTSTGHKIYSESGPFNMQDLIKKNKDNLYGILNLVVIKYIFNGIVILGQLYIIYDIYGKKNNYYDRYRKLMDRIIIMIFISMLLGVFNLDQSIILYTIVLIGLTIGLSRLIDKVGINTFPNIPMLTNIIILFAVFFYPDMIYRSFYGFNNLISGGRFYGLNNETMAILIATGIITFLWLKRKIKNKALSTIALCLYFPIIIIALSERYATNFGGYLTSIAAFLILLYIIVFKGKYSKRTMLTLCSIGVVIFILGFVIKIGDASSGHAESLYLRIDTLGIYELIDMIKKKAKQLLLISISPPWSIIIIGQIYFIRKFFLKERTIEEDTFNEILTILITSIFAFLLNDTGAVALVYMNTYVLTKLIHWYSISRTKLE